MLSAFEQVRARTEPHTIGVAKPKGADVKFTEAGWLRPSNEFIKRL